MAKRKARSVFWVVSTHVLTTGFAMPAVASLVGFAIIVGLQLSEVAAFLVSFVLVTFGYIGGVYYSLSYIRRVALIERPSACVKPSIVVFIIFALLGFAFAAIRILRQHESTGINPVLSIAVLAVFYIVISLAFAWITKHSFASMEPHAKEDVNNIQEQL